MAHRRRGGRKMTLMEMMIVAAIGAILLSIIVPNLKQSSRRASLRQARRIVTSAPESAGQLNTIEMPETTRQNSREDSSRSKNPAGSLLRIIISILIAVTIINIARRRLRSAQQ